jgi:hypothetical protein
LERVIIKWLKGGNVQPLAYWFAHGLAPPRRTLEYFAAMLGPNREDHLEAIPYRLCPHRRSRAHGRPRSSDQCATLIERLNNGDVSLLRSILIGEEPPEPQTLRHLARMLVPSEGTEAEVPYEFTVKYRWKGRRAKRDDLVTKLRNVFIADFFAQQHEKMGRGSYKGIKYDVAQATGLSEETVRKAYDRYYGKNQTKLP